MMNTEKTVTIRIWSHEIDADALTPQQLYEQLHDSFQSIKVKSA